VCDLEREIRRRLSGRILGVHPFANPNYALPPGREQIGVNGGTAKTRGAINGTSLPFVQLSKNGQLPLAERAVRSRISANVWQQVKTAYAKGIGLREIAL
jgi:hypothetical protein